MLYPILYSLAGFIYLSFGLFVLVIDHRSALYRAFFRLCVIYGLWSLSHLFMELFPGGGQYSLWLCLGNIAMILHAPMALHLMLVFSKRLQHRRSNYIILPVTYALPAVIVSLCIANPAIALNDYPINKWHFYYLIYYTVYSLPGLTSIVLWARKSRLRREKRQGYILVGFELIITPAAMALDALMPYYSLRSGPMLTPVVMILWYVAVLFIVIKYRVIVTPGMLKADIVSFFDEAVLLLDHKNRILILNKKCEELLSLSTADYLNRDISSIIIEHDPLTREIETMKDASHDSFSARVHFRASDNQSHLMDIRTSIVYDTIGDMAGILIAGKEVKELTQLNSRFNITEREMEIINHVITGIPYRQIAHELGITERTVKAHVTSIYNKLVIENRVQLINLLKEYDLLPEKPADKKLLLINRN